MPRSFRYCRPRQNPEETLLDVLSKKYQYLTRPQWIAMITEGYVTVNHQRVIPETILPSNSMKDDERHQQKKMMLEKNNKKEDTLDDGECHCRKNDDSLTKLPSSSKMIVESFILQQKDIVRFNPPEDMEPTIDSQFQILHWDEDCIVVEKSGNIPVTECGKYYHHTLVHVVGKFLFEEKPQKERIEKEKEKEDQFVKQKATPTTTSDATSDRQQQKIINDEKEEEKKESSSKILIQETPARKEEEKKRKMKKKKEGEEIIEEEEEGDFGVVPLFPVHRLDKETSGLVVLARHRRSAKMLSEQFSATAAVMAKKESRRQKQEAQEDEEQDEKMDNCCVHKEKNEILLDSKTKITTAIASKEILRQDIEEVERKERKGWPEKQQDEKEDAQEVLHQKIYEAILVGELKQPVFVKLRIGLLSEGQQQPLPVAEGAKAVRRKTALPLETSAGDEEGAATLFSRLRMATYPEDSPFGKPASTCIEPLLAKNGLTYAKITLFTGRTHQIRLHCQAVGHAILGDKLYLPIIALPPLQKDEGEEGFRRREMVKGKEGEGNSEREAVSTIPQGSTVSQASDQLFIQRSRGESLVTWRPPSSISTTLSASCLSASSMEANNNSKGNVPQGQEELVVPRQLLHAGELSFMLPGGNKRMRWKTDGKSIFCRDCPFLKDLLF